MIKKIALFSLFLIFLFVSCNSGEIGIFYQISVEQPLSDSALAEKTVYNIASDSSNNIFVQAGGSVYKKNGSDWDLIDPPSGEIQAVSLASDGTNIYSVYADNSNSSLYQMAGTASSWSTANDTQLNNSNDLTVINGDSSYIFVCQENSSGSYDIWSYDGTSLAEISTASIPAPVISAAHDSTAYYLIASDYTTLENNSALYTSADGAASSMSEVADDLPATKALGGIVAYGTDLYVSTRDGYLYTTDTGVDVTAWTSVNSSAIQDSNEDDAVLGNMEIVTVSTDYLLIASNTGYFEMDLAGSSIGLPDVTVRGDTVYKSIDLYDEYVFSLLEDPASPGYFYIGSENGLWYSDNEGIDLK